MNQIQFNDICEATARAFEPSKQDGRYPFSADENEILMDFDAGEDAETLSSASIWASRAPTTAPRSVSN